MTNRKSTKRALRGSVMAMVLCLAMLVGATFAWFTDTASTGVNKIQAGNLDIELQYATKWDANGVPTKWENAEGKTLPFLVNGGIPAEGTQILWEPGCTYMLPELRVVNKGNLAVKYKVAITGINGSAKLNNVIDWTINDADINLTEMQLKAGAEGAAFTIKSHMQESAGNDYMNESIDGIAITVYATQDTVESDSFNNTYDENATYPVVNVTELKEALTNDGYYYGGGTAVQVQEGTLVINGGTFACEPYSNPTYGYNFLINCVDSAYKNGTAKVIINGGTFVNFDPSNCTAEGAHTNFVADGYKVVSETHGTDTWYTVVKG